MILRAAIVLVFLAAVPASAAAQDNTPRPAAKNTVVHFLAGAAAGLGVHEGGHVLTGLSFGSHPRIDAIRYGPLPFFAIRHDAVTRRREYVISASGFWMQHAGSEWILTTHPNLRREDEPFLTGVLAFNLATSAVYSAAALGRFGPPERDTRGMAVSLGRTGAPEPVVGVLVLGPAVLDGYRYFHPEQEWARWVSRGLKVVGVVLTAAAGR